MAEEAPAEEAPKVPGDLKQWIAKTSSTCMKARNQSTDMLTRLQKIEAAEAAQKQESQAEANREREKIKNAAKGRIRCHEAIINGTTKAMADCEDAILKLEDVAIRATHERYARFADSQVNQRRSELRAKRPAEEAFKDILQVNLEREDKVLKECRKELLEREGILKNLIKDLVDIRGVLSADTGTRRLKIEHEMQLLKPPAPSVPAHGGGHGGHGATQAATAAPAEAAPDAAGAPASPAAAPATPAAAAPSPKAGEATPAADSAPSAAPASPTAGGAAGHGKGKPVLADVALDGPEAVKHIKKAYELLTNVNSACEKTEEVIVASKYKAREATTASEKSLARRTIDLSGIKKALEQHIGDVNYAIIEAERGLDKHMKRLNPADQAKAQKLEATKNLLDNLRSTRAALTSDLRTKIDALNIDNSCRRVTPQVAAEKRPPSAGNKTMKKNASAPNMDATGASAGEAAVAAPPTPSSPAGNSKPLKAAAAAAVAN